jgi:hypothetical protein
VYSLTDAEIMGLTMLQFNAKLEQAALVTRLTRGGM